MGIDYSEVRRQAEFQPREAGNQPYRIEEHAAAPVRQDVRNAEDPAGKLNDKA